MPFFVVTALAVTELYHWRLRSSVLRTITTRYLAIDSTRLMAEEHLRPVLAQHVAAVAYLDLGLWYVGHIPILDFDEAHDFNRLSHQSATALGLTADKVASRMSSQMSMSMRLP